MSQARMRRQIMLSYLPRLINLIVVPIQIALLTQQLSLEQYGIWNMLLSSGFVATMVFSLGLQKILSIKVPGRNLYTQLSFFKAVLLAESIAYIGLSIIFLGLCLPWVLPLLNIEGQHNAVIVITAAFFINLIYNEFGRLFNYQKRIEVRILIGCFEKILELGLLYLAIYGFDVKNLGQLAFIYIALYSMLLCANLIFFRGTRLFWQLKVRLSVIKYALLFGAPLILSDVAWKLIQNVDFYMLSGFNRHAELGLYAFVSRLTNYIYLAASPIIWVVYPYLVEAHHKGGNRITLDTRNLLNQQLQYCFIFLLAALGGMLINFDWLVSLLGTEAYKNNQQAYYLYAPYPLLLTLMYLGQQILLLDKKTKLISSSYLVGLAVNIAGNSLLIPQLGLHGAILSTLGALLVILVIQGWHFSPIRLLSGKLILFGAVQVAVVCLFIYSSWHAFIETVLFAGQLLALSFVLSLVDLHPLNKFLNRQ